MGDQIINKSMIDEVVKDFPYGYIKALAKKAFGRATDRNIRKVKHWRSGKMQNKFQSRKLYSAAQILAAEYETEITLNQ